MSYKLGPRWNGAITRLDFKFEAIFGFLSPNYTGHVTWFFSWNLKWPRFTSLKMLPRKSAFQGVLSELRLLSSMPETSYPNIESDTHYERKSSTLNTFLEKKLARTKLSLVQTSTILSTARRSAWLPELIKKSICHWTEAPQKGLRSRN